MHIKTKSVKFFGRVAAVVFVLAGLLGVGIKLTQQTPSVVADSPMVEGVTPSNGLSYGTLTTYIYRINNGLGGAPCWNGGSGCYTSHAMCLQPTKASQVGDYGYVSSDAADAVKKIIMVSDAAVNSTIYNAFRSSSGIDLEAIGGQINGGVGAVTYGSGGYYTAGQARAFMVGHILAGAAYTGTIYSGYYDGISDYGTTAALNLAYQTIMDWFNSNYTDAPAQFTLNTFTPSDYTHQTLGWVTGSYTPTPPPVRKGYIQLLKYDNATGYQAALNGTGVLSGATFRVYKQGSSTTLATRTTDSSGYTPSFEANEGETICFVETSAPTGYVLDTTPVCNTIVAGGTSYIAFGNARETTYGGVRVRKVDSETNTANARGTASVQGTRFTVYKSDSSGNVGASTGVTMTADASGYATTSNSALAIDPVAGGSWYCVKETAAGTGYNLSDTSCKKFYLSTTGQIYDLTGSPFKDTVIRGSLTITKQRKILTSLSSEWVDAPLAGVTFTLINTADANIAYTTSATNADGVVTLNNIMYGTYNVTENRTQFNSAYNLQNFTITISSQGQTVTKSVMNTLPDNPALNTTARNSNSNPTDPTNPSEDDKEIEVGQNAGVTDHMIYSGLQAGADYKIEGELWKITPPQEIIAVTSHDFTAPSNGQGNFEVDFSSVDTTNYTGEQLSIVQKLYKKNGNEWLYIMAHNADFSDANEVVTVANYGLSTTATDDADNDHMIEPERAQVVRDRVVYQNLVQGRDYILVARLIDKNATVADGQTRVLRINDTEVPAIVTKITMPAQTEASTTVRFNIDATDIPGRELVVYERLYEYVEGANSSNWETVLTELVIAHEDLNDTNQTIKVRPRIGTQASDEYDNDNKVGAGVATIIDKVSLEGLSKERYKLVGYIVEKKGENGSETVDTPIQAPNEEGNVVEIKVSSAMDLRNASAIPTEAEMRFVFDTREFAGKEIVIYEELYRVENNGSETLIAWHKDVNDEKQTVEVFEPKIKTKALDAADNDKVLALDKEVTITDQIDYEGLVPGNKYTLVGELHDKKTGDVVELVDGSTKVIHVFEPAQDRGVELMDFVVDTRKMSGKELVVFEELYFGEWIIEEVDEETGDVITPAVELTEEDKLTEHKNINSDNQTVKVIVEKPDTGIFSSESEGAEAGQVYVMPVVIIAISFGALAGYRIFRKRSFGWK